MGFSEQRTASEVQSRVWRRYGKFARQQGTMTGIYRPIDALDPFANQVAEIPAVFTNNYAFAKPDRFGTSWLFAIFDGTLAQAGDYLVTPPFDKASELGYSNRSGMSDVFYIASMDLNSPIVVVECSRTISISRVATPTASFSGMKGTLGYAGSTQDKEVVLMQNWRASILQGTKGEANLAHLPSDVRMPWWIIFMPSFPGLILDTGDIVRDDLGRKYMISSAELTNMGWRLTATYERT